MWLISSFGDYFISSLFIKSFNDYFQIEHMWLRNHKQPTNLN